METKIRENNAVHIPVLLHEAIKLLDVKPNGIYLDCTEGLGGHSSEILKVLVKGTGKLYGIDKDVESLVPAEKRLLEIDPSHEHFELIHGSFAKLKEMLEERGIHAKSVDGILFDLGVSSAHYDNAWRGFSYRNDGPLDMRMDLSQKYTASYLINKEPPICMYKAFKYFGDEPYAEDIMLHIWNYREDVKPVETTKELEKLILEALPAKVRNTRKHPAQKCFQGIRIWVNDELDDIQAGLRSAFEMLAYGGHVVVITFHSLEDKTVKGIIKEYTDFEGDRINDFRMPKDYILPEFVVERKKVIVPTAEEIEANPRSRSAKLRAVTRVERHY